MNDQINELPIICSKPVVASLIAGWKTKTRRIINHGLSDATMANPLIKPSVTDLGEMVHFKVENGLPTESFCGVKNRYGKIGDILWVRENWKIQSWDFDDYTCNIEYATSETQECYLDMDSDVGTFSAVWLQDQIDKMVEKGLWEHFEKEGQEEDELFYKRTDKIQPFKPSIHMPKQAARIWLQIEDITVERLQDITEEDAIAEGIESDSSEGIKYYKNYDQFPYLQEFEFSNPRDSFQSLWESINGSESWQLNPFVWVITFKVLSTTGKPENN